MLFSVEIAQMFSKSLTLCIPRQRRKFAPSKQIGAAVKEVEDLGSVSSFLSAWNTSIEVEAKKSPSMAIFKHI